MERNMNRVTDQVHEPRELEVPERETNDIDLGPPREALAVGRGTLNVLRVEAPTPTAPSEVLLDEPVLVETPTPTAPPEYL